MHCRVTAADDRDMLIAIAFLQLSDDIGNSVENLLRIVALALRRAHLGPGHPDVAAAPKSKIIYQKFTEY